MSSPRRMWHLSTLLAGVFRAFRALLPSFIADAVWPDTCPRSHHVDCCCHQRKAHNHNTSYLDGLRGVASFIVFLCHYTEKRHGYFLPAYGLEDCVDGRGGEEPSILQLPYIRVLYSGRPMVHVFFVISGFVLAYKPLRLLHSQPHNPIGFYDALASSAFRRPIRLFLPCAVSTLGVAILCQTGQLYAADATWSGQLRSWAGQYAGRVVWPWAWDYDLRPGYNIHLWTIPIEFAHAMLLFLVLLTLCRLRTRLRQATAVLLAAYCLACGKWAAFEFLTGLAFAEIHILRRPSRHASVVICFGGCARLPQLRTLAVYAYHNLSVVFHTTLLASCLFVAGWPNENASKTPGIRFLLSSTPAWFLRNAGSQAVSGVVPAEGEALLEQKFWFSLAAVGIVWSCGELDAVRRLFARPLAQYCGRISYAMYLVHGPALDYFQDMVLGRPGVQLVMKDGVLPSEPGTGVKGRIGVDTPTQRTMCWIMGAIILGGIVVWLADLFWRFVDAPIVRLGRVVEGACFCPAQVKIASSKTDEESDLRRQGEFSVLVRSLGA